MRMSFAGVAVGLVLFVAPVRGQPSPLHKGEELAPDVAPDICRATASEEKGEVVVRISWRSLRITAGVESKPTHPWVYVWEHVKPLTLGKEVQAYSQAGKPLDKEAVMKVLAKPVSVVCFVRNQGDAEMPDPLYLEMLREDAMILVFKAEDTRR